MQTDETLAPMLTVDEVAAALKTTPDHVRRLAKVGALPAVKIGRGSKPRLRFRRRDIAAMIDGAAP